MVAVARLPHPRLRSFVETVWASEGSGPGGVDRMLPSASGHVVFRVAAEPFAERLAAARTVEDLARLFEALLIERLHDVTVPPAVALGLARLPSSTVGEVVGESGLSHRCFALAFTRVTGLSPKRYARLARFERVLRAWRERPTTPLAQLAHLTGYSDQAHLTREFGEFAGMPPAAYAASAAVGSRHVPVRDGVVSGVNFVQDGTRRRTPR